MFLRPVSRKRELRFGHIGKFFVPLSINALGTNLVVLPFVDRKKTIADYIGSVIMYPR